MGTERGSRIVMSHFSIEKPLKKRVLQFFFSVFVIINSLHGRGRDCRILIDDEHINNLQFVNDIVLVTTTHEDSTVKRYHPHYYHSFRFNSEIKEIPKPPPPYIGRVSSIYRWNARRQIV